MKIGKLFNNEDGSSTKTSVEFELVDRTNYGIEVELTGSSLAGTMEIIASITGQTYISITESAVILSGGDDLMYSVSNGNYRYVKLRWTPTSGTGNINATFLIKQEPR